jgi:hypothetical protein
MDGSDASGERVAEKDSASCVIHGGASRRKL